jgi:hypothetical protein
MTDYSQGKIYVLKSSQTDDVYIGSTKETLEDRFDSHKRDYKKWLNGKTHYITSFDLMKYDDVYIELLEDYPCNSKKELELEEGKYQRIMNCVNKRIEGRTHKEWIEDHREEIKEYQKKYREDNKEHLKEYREDNKDKYKDKYKQKFKCICGKEIRRDNKRRHEKSTVHIKYIEDMKENGDIDNVTEFFEQFRISYKST